MGTSKARDVDALIIGAGHNGLTAAGYLAKVGLRVLVLERRDVVGGASITEEFHPGFRASAPCYVVSLLRDEVVRDLELARFGYRTIPMPLSSAMLPDGRYLILSGEDECDRAQIEAHSKKDWPAYRRFYADLQDVAEVLADWVLREPPSLEGGWLNLWQGLRLGRGVASLSPEHRHRLLQLVMSPLGPLLDRYFESEILKIKMAAGTTIANPISLNQPGGALNLLHLTMGEIEGERGAWALAKGGMGSITQAMAASARERGVEIRTEAPVARILVDAGRALGVQLESGAEITAGVVLANTDPKRTFLGLLGAEHLDADFAADLRKWRQDSGSFRMNVALSGTPRLAGIPDRDVRPMLESMFCVAPSLESFEKAYWTSRQGLLPDPIVVSDAHFPSVLDDSLAPAGCHVMSVHAQHYPFELAGGRSWQETRDEAANALLDTMAHYVANLREITVGWKAYSPWDQEQVFGLTGGDVYHGRLDPDQMFSLRPHPKAARYRTPVAGLYLCGSGAHPGGGVSGGPGHNAARRVLADRGRHWQPA
jgi:phytoene dehydrogenase-like protein